MRQVRKRSTQQALSDFSLTFKSGSHGLFKGASRVKERLAMGISICMSVVVCAFVAGCGSAVQVGLANAPVLGGATPETRVHDVIANGRDACERSAFPPGEVLRGQLPPCSSKETTPAIPRTVLPSARTSPGYSLRMCSSAAPRPTRAELGLAAISFSSSEGLVCRYPW